MHDGAPAHFSRDVRDVLNNTYHDRWVGTGGPTAWPPHSPGVNPLDFYLWGLLKARVYADPISNEGELHHRIVDTRQTIGKFPGIFERMRQSMSRYAWNRVEDIMSTYYKRTLSAIIHKLNVSGHVLIWTIFLALVFGTHTQNFSALFSYVLY
jgi:hypothetical protein